MDKPNFRELVDLPGLFTFKVFVRPDQMDQPAFLAFTRQTLNRDLGNHDVSARSSSKGGYRAYTLSIHLETHDELEQLYVAYQNHEAVVYIL